MLLKFANCEVLKIARVKYRGGGDWYNDPKAIPNMLMEFNKRTKIETDSQQEIVSLEDEKLFNFPFIFLTGHGNITLNEREIKNLREYIEKGGFLYVDDDYGMDEYFRREIKKVFPEEELVEVPYSDDIFHIFYNFANGAPKIHEHYEGAPRCYGIYKDEVIVVFYTYNTNISDGWVETHKDPPEKREEAFRMGVNIILYALMH